MTNPKRSEREIEATLIICSEDPQTIAGLIADLKSIGDYQLLPQETQIIHDLYFDTPDHVMQAQKIALRIREIGTRRWVAIKGHSQMIDGEGGVERLEIEEEWSEGALTKILKELRNRGIKIMPPCQDPGYAHPLDIIIDLGLEIVQDRETHREVRNITKNRESNLILAELAVDSVIYHFINQKVRHYEVEIEEKTENGSAVLRMVSQNLVRMFTPVLRKWVYSKLATGKIIEKLLRDGSLKGLLDMDNNLKPAAYTKIEDCLKSSTG